MAKICSNCGATNEPEFIYCYQCGAPVDIPAGATPIMENELISCLNCGAQNPFTYKFCYNCGYGLIPAPGIPEGEVEPVGETVTVIEEQVTAEKPEMNTCPDCSGLNPTNYKFCGICGFDLTTLQEAAPEAPVEEVSQPEEAQPTEEAPPAEEQEAVSAEETTPVTEEQATEEKKPVMMPCPNCGELNPIDYKFCGICGFNLKVPAETPAEEAPPEKKPPEEKEIKAPEKEPPAIEDVFIAEEEALAPVRISTGIEGLDPLIDGGFIKNKVYLVSGGPGTGQTIFGLQYLYHGLKNGENGLYFSGDEKPEQLILDAKSLGWDLTRFIDEKRLVLVDSSHHFYDLYTGKSKSIDNRTFVNDLTRQMKKLNAKRLVIDPVAPLLTGEEHCTNIQEYLRNLIFTIESSFECTALITSGNQANVSSFSRYGIEEMMTGGIIILSMDKRKRTGERIRTLFIPKMRSTPIELKEHTFEIQQNKGIVLLD